MNTADHIIGHIYSSLKAAESNRVVISRLTFNFSFFLIWNEERQDYCIIKINLVPSKKNEIYNKHKDLMDTINEIVSDFMTTGQMLLKDAMVFYYNETVYRMKMELTRIMKKTIIIENKAPKTDNLIDQKIISLIQDAGSKGISISEITQKTQTISKKERYAILDELIKDEIIFLRPDTSKGRQRKVYYYE